MASGAALEGGGRANFFAGAPPQGRGPDFNQIGDLDGREVTSLEKQVTEVEGKARNAFSRMCSSPLFWSCVSAAILLAATITILTGAFGLFGLIFIPAVGIGAIPAGIYAYTHAGEIKNEADMMATQFTQFTGDSWMSTIDDNFVLGGLPLKNKGHIKDIVIDRGATNIISVVDRNELEFVGILFEPVPPADWKELGIDHQIFSTKQGETPNIPFIERAIDHIDGVLSKNPKAIFYVHDDSGNARAPTLLACYFVHKLAQDPKFQAKPLDWTKQAFEKIRESRSQFNPTPAMTSTVQKYHMRLLEERGMPITALTADSMTGSIRRLPPGFSLGGGAHVGATAPPPAYSATGHQPYGGGGGGTHGHAQ